jgi:hypothetical protein
MRIGIFETTHFEGAYPVIRLFDNGKNELTIFTYEESYRQFQFLFKNELAKFNWVVKKKEESKYDFIRRIYKETRKNQLELLYLNTITDNYIFYSLMISALKRVRIIVTLHSINNYFYHKPAFSPRRMVRILGKKRLIYVAREFNVVALTMVDYLKDRLPPSKKVHCVPGAVFEGRPAYKSRQEQRDAINLVVPGVVDERRRDYDLVLQLVRKVEGAGMKIKITLLGGIHPLFGKSIHEKLRNLDARGVLTYYETDVVDQPEFDKVMDEADLVLLPSTVENTILDDIQEVYGLSMSSGNLFDIIKHAKPFIAPLRLRVDPYLEGSCLRYESVDEIIDVLSALSNSPEVFANLKSKARAASENYTIEAVRERNKNLFG